MPLYEYICSRCDETFEEIISPGATRLPECPKCKGHDVEKIPICQCSFALKDGGVGWSPEGYSGGKK